MTKKKRVQVILLVHLLVLVVFASSFISSKSFAMIVFDPSNYAKNLITAENSARAIENQITQIHNQLEFLNYEAKNSNGLSSYQWQNITQLMQKLDQTTQQEQALSYSMADLDSQFKTRYPNYTKSYGNNDYSNAYHQWNATTLDTLRQSLNSIGMSANDFQNEQALLQQLKTQGQTATGRMQALQVSTEIAAENVNQVQELKRIMMSQANAQDAYMAYEVSKDSYNEQSLEDINSHVDSAFPNYQNNTSLGTIPSM